MNSKTFIKFLDSWITSPSKIVPFIHGQAGIGKTDIISEIAKKYDYNLVILNLAHQEEGDLIGIPYKQDNIMYYSKPEWLALNEHKKTLCFLDEYDRAQPNIMNCGLTIVREYRIHTHHLPSNWKMIAAGNSGINDDFYNTTEMDFAMKSRFCHLFYKLETSEWLEWAEKHNIHPFIIQYLTLTPKDLIVEPKDNIVISYPNPRTWHILSESLYFAPESLWKDISIGCIGKDIGTSFWTFTQTSKKEDLPVNLWQFFKNENIMKELPKQLNTRTNKGLQATLQSLMNNLDNIKKYKQDEVFVLLGVLFTFFMENNKIEFCANLFQIFPQKTKEIFIDFLSNHQKFKSTYHKYVQTITKFQTI